MVRVAAGVEAEIVRRIIPLSRPRKIVLFGSRARGEERPGSDFDILVIADTKTPRHLRSVSLYGALSDIIEPMDIVVYTPEEAAEWRDVPAAFITTALREGRVLYEKE